jgi:hypothetical protein
MKHVLSTLKTLVASALLIATLALPASAVDPKQGLCEGSGGTWSGTSCSGAANEPQVTGTFKLVADILLFVLGSIAVIMIIIGGIRYVSSNGDQAQVTGAKNTILYSVIGLVLALAAYAIVNFVTARIQAGS